MPYFFGDVEKELRSLESSPMGDTLYDLNCIGTGFQISIPNVELYW